MVTVEPSEAGLAIEVVLALPDSVRRIDLRLPAGCRVGQVLQHPDVRTLLATQSVEQLTVGIFGRPCGTDARLTEGDRVEFYRPLTVDPKEARRARELARQRRSRRGPAD